MNNSVNRIEFIEEDHLYILDGWKVLPSVTQILKDDKYDSIPQFILEKAALKGTAVHKATENYDLDKEVYIETNYKPYFNAYVDFRLEHPEIALKLDERESIVFTDKYAGTIDIVAENETSWLIADIKTTSKLYLDSIAKQLAAYILAHADMYGNDLNQYKGAVIWLKKDGSYEYHEIEPDYQGFDDKLNEYMEEEWINIKKKKYGVT